MHAAKSCPYCTAVFKGEFHAQIHANLCWRPLFILIATAACAVSGLPSTSPDAVSTIVAATLQAITPEATQTSIPPTPVTPTPLLPTLAPSSSSVPPTLQPVSPTLVVPGATRISFLTDATSSVITGPIQAGGTLNYVLQAFQGQPMLVNVDAPNHDITLSIKTQGGTSMLNASAGQATWQGTLPQTEDYYISLHGGASSENFTLSITHTVAHQVRGRCDLGQGPRQNGGRL